MSLPHCTCFNHPCGNHASSIQMRDVLHDFDKSDPFPPSDYYPRPLFLPCLASSTHQPNQTAGKMQYQAPLLYFNVNYSVVETLSKTSATLRRQHFLPIQNTIPMNRSMPTTPISFLPPFFPTSLNLFIATTQTTGHKLSGTPKQGRADTTPFVPTCVSWFWHGV